MTIFTLPSTMHPLEHKLAALRRRVRRLAVVYALSRAVAVVLAAAMLLGVADYLVRFRDPGLRVMASLAMLAAAAWAGYRHVYRTLATHLADAELARRLERHFPRLGDRLASAVDFLRQSEGDPAAGSVALRRAVVSQVTAESETFDFRSVTRTSPAVQAVLTTAAMLLAAIVLVLADPLACQTAVARLAYPLGNVTWPKSTHLALRQRVDRVARGQAFEVEVIDQYGARLPPDVRIHYRFENADGTVAEEAEPMRFVAGAMTARRDNVTRPFLYRVRGGDDHSMPWTAVELIEPPAIASLVVRLFPPDYTGWPPETADKNFRALAGTRVEIAAQASKALGSAVLRWLDGREIPCQLSEDGLSLVVPSPPTPLSQGAREAMPLVVEQSGSYYFKLADQEGIHSSGETRWEVRAVADNPPSVAVEQPGANLFVTAAATVMLRIVAKDDLAIRTIGLSFTRSDRPDDPETTVPLYAGPERAAPPPASGALRGAADPTAALGAGLPTPPPATESSPPGESREIVHPWHLAELGLRPGTQVNFHAVASDYRPQSGRSEPRRVVVITPEELAERIAERQAAVLRELARALQMQRENRRQVAGLEIQLREVRQLTRLDLDRLRGAELNQRQIQQTLTSRDEGVPMHILGLLADLTSNRVDSPDVERQARGLLAEIDRLAKEHLAPIAQQLTGAAKSAQITLDEAADPVGRIGNPSHDDVPRGPKTGSKQTVEPDPAIVPSLVAAGKHQDAVIAALEQILGNLSRAEHFRRFHREIGQLLRDQEELARTTAELGRRTLAKDPKDLLPQEAADLKVAAAGQRDRARRLERIEQDMEPAARELGESDPLAAETLAEALARARQLALAGQMRSAAGSLEANRMGEAMDRQKRAVQGLQEVLDILANRREPEPGRIIQRLRQIADELEALIQKQEALCKQMQSTADDPQGRRALDEAARQQQALRENTQRLAREMERLGAGAAAKPTGQAANQMQQSCQAAGQGRGGEAAAKATEAQKSLREAARLLAQQRRLAEADLAAEQVARLQDTLRQVRERQQKVLEQTQQYDKLQQSQGRLTRDQAAAVRDLARDQGALQSETATLAERLASAEVFQLALAGAAAQMQRAAGLLDERQTGSPTQQAELTALARLEQMLVALEPEKTEGGPSEAPGGETGPQDNHAQRGALRSLAELKLVRLMQEQVNRRTRELEQAFGATGRLTDEARRDYQELSLEQGRLAELVLRLFEPAGAEDDAPKTDPKAPPSAQPQGEGEIP